MLTLLQLQQTGIFKKEFPERHIDCGIAECNMIGIAAGLATTGKVLLPVHLQCLQQAVLMMQVRNSVRLS